MRCRQENIIFTTKDLKLLRRLNAISNVSETRSQLRELTVCIQWIVRSFITSTLMMEAKTVSETLDINYILTWLIVREGFILLYSLDFIFAL
jgi:hypothetical protein